MSILIKGMEMPKNCSDCPCLSDTDYCMVDGVHPADCGILIQNTENGNEIVGRLPNCPLIELPPQGRLIDADALRDKWIWGDTDRLGHTKVVEVIDIDDAPTIIEADTCNNAEETCDGDEDAPVNANYDDIPMEYFEAGGK